MSGAHDKAFKDLQRFAEQFSGVLALATAMRDVGSIEQAADEARQRAEASIKLEEESKARLAGIQAEIEKHTAVHADHVQTAADELTAARTKAAEVTKETRQQANQTLAEAGATAEDTIADARKRATQMLAAAEAEAVAKGRNADAALVGIRKQEETAQSKLDAINTAVAAAEERLAEINAEIERVRARFA